MIASFMMMMMMMMMMKIMMMVTTMMIVMFICSSGFPIHSDIQLSSRRSWNFLAFPDL